MGNKKVGVLAIYVALFLVFGVAAAASNIPDAVSDVVKEKGLNVEDISSVKSVNYSDLPPQIDIENIDDTNLEIYEVQVQDDKLFVLTFGEVQEVAATTSESREFLSYGYSGEISEGFLESASGVSMSANRGYVMMRDGSITGISTSLEVVNAVSDGRVQVVIYKNGEAINFGNEVSSSSSGMEKDYDVQSSGVVTYEAGDTISVYLNGEGALLRDVITMIEISNK